MVAITPRLLENSETFQDAFAKLEFKGPVAGVTPENSGTTGGVIIKANAAGDAFFQVVNADKTAEKFNILFRSGLMITSGLTKTTRLALDSKNDFLSGTAGAFMAADGYWLAQKPFDLTDAATILVDLSKGRNFAVTLGDNRTLDFPSSLRLGQSGYIRVKQDATGGRTLGYAPGYRYTDNVTPPILNSAAGEVTIIRYEVTATGEVSLSGGKGLSPVVVEATAAEFRAGTAGKLLTPSAIVQANAVVTITETDLTAGLDFRNFINAKVTLTANRKLGNPAALGMVPGKSGTITFIMGGTGGYSLTFDDQWWSPSGFLPTLPPAVGGIHRMRYEVMENGQVDFFFATSMGRTFQAEASAYFDAMTVPPSAARKQLIADLIAGLKTDNVWQFLDNLWLLAAHNDQASRINLIRPSKILTKAGDPYFVEDRGWQSSSTAGATNGSRLLSPDPYIGRTLNRSTIGHVAFGVWQNTIFAEPGGGTALCGDNGPGDKEFLNSRTDNDSITGGISNYRQVSTSTPGKKGFKAISSYNPSNTHEGRINNFRAFYNATPGTPDLGTYDGESPTNNETASFSILGTASRSSANRMAASFTGAGLTNAQMLALYNRLNTYLTAIGAN